MITEIKVLVLVDKIALIDYSEELLHCIFRKVTFQVPEYIRLYK